MLQLWRARPYLVSSFLLACVVTLFFGVRFVSKLVYWADPAHHEQTVQGWMTVGYVARSWDLDAREIDEVAGLPLPKVKGHPQPLSEIAADRGVPVETVIDAVERAILLLRQREPMQK